MSGQILHSVCAPFVRSPNGGRYALRIFPMRDWIRTCVSLWNSRGAVVNSLLEFNEPTLPLNPPSTVALDVLNHISTALSTIGAAF
jgi:hypothetical protein